MQMVVQAHSLVFRNEIIEIPCASWCGWMLWQLVGVWMLAVCMELAGAQVNVESNIVTKPLVFWSWALYMAPLAIQVTLLLNLLDCEKQQQHHPQQHQHLSRLLLLIFYMLLRGGVVVV